MWRVLGILFLSAIAASAGILLVVRVAAALQSAGSLLP